MLSEALRANHFGADAWEELVSAGNLATWRTCTTTNGWREEARYIFHKLTHAIGRDIPAIRADCERLAIIVKDVMSKFRTRMAARATAKVRV